MDNPFRFGQYQHVGKYWRPAVLSTSLTALLAAFMMSATAPALSAEPPETNTKAAANDDTPALTLQHEITNAIDDNAVSVAITSSPHQLTIDLINSRQNNATPAVRKKEAIKLASILENLITGKKIYSDVTALHVDYSRISDGHTRPVQKFNFVQTPAGVFVLKRN